MANRGGDKFKKALGRVAIAVKDLKLDSLPEIGQMVAERIVAKARSGKSMYSGQEKPMRELSSPYIAYRKSIIKNEAKKIKQEYKKQKRSLKGKSAQINLRARMQAKLDPQFFKPTKSNLTLTGTYLRSIRVEKIDYAKTEITIAPDDEQHGDDEFTNKQLAEYLSKMGRSVFGIDDTTKARIKAIIKRDIRTAIKKNLLK